MKDTAKINNSPMCKGHKLNLTHGKSYSSEYNIWHGIKLRCNNPNDPAYKYYGGRGITICKEWNISFEAFYKDMGDRPGSQYSIDRIENDKGYCKENCRWATSTEQSLNKRGLVWVMYGGNKITQDALAKICNVHPVAVSYWVKKGWSGEKIGNYFNTKNMNKEKDALTKRLANKGLNNEQVEFLHRYIIENKITRRDENPFISGFKAALQQKSVMDNLEERYYKELFDDLVTLLNERRSKYALQGAHEWKIEGFDLAVSFVKENKL